jgi:hypothetical protein
MLWFDSGEPLVGVSLLRPCGGRTVGEQQASWNSVCVDISIIELIQI